MMNIEYIVKKSNQLSTDEKQQLCNMFEIIFAQKRTLHELETIFTSNHKGYIYIALMLDEKKNIIGTMSVIPLRYRYFEQEMTFGRGIDAMIFESYRGNLLNLKKMSDLLEKSMKEDGVPFIFSAPNELNYPVRKRISKWKDIYNLDIYALPIKVGAVKPRLKLLNFFSQAYAQLVNLFASSRCNEEKLLPYSIQKVNDEAFIETRYNESYMTVKCDNGVSFIYKVKNFNEIETAFIIDIVPMNKVNLQVAVKHIVKHEKKVDLIVYFGYLAFKPLNLYKIPEKFKPKNTYVSGKILLPEMIDERIFEIEHWHFNLSDLDWI